MTEFDMVTQVDEKLISRRVSHVPSRPKGAGSQRPPKFGTSIPTPKRFDLKRPNLVWYSTSVTGASFWGSATPPSTVGWTPASQKIYGHPTCARTVSETTIKFCMVIKLRMHEEHFYTVDMAGLRHRPTRPWPRAPRF